MTRHSPAPIREIENIWIPVRDGTRLAARLWMPEDADNNPVPAILEYIPYRKRDFMRPRDEPMHRYFAGAGYAALRVDLRGSGDSEGVLADEYDPCEQQDAIDIIAWIAAQPWCDGAVGMTGISWGGFNALQVAALRPPALKAVISLCASDDRYADDAHYKGGCLLGENLQWGSILTLYNALPPDPEIVGENWRAMWRQRLEALRPMPAEWMRHPARDAYWRQGSVAEDYPAIACPVYAIGGWADGYTNAVPRLLTGLTCPKKALIGPWVHAYPHIAVPGPAIDYLAEAVRWWDHWLKGRDTGIMDEPMLRAWIQDAVRPAPQHDVRPGRWVAEDTWPSPRIADALLYPQRGRLNRAPCQPVEETVSSPLTVGMRGGEWCGFGADGEAARDQRPDDGGSLIFDSDPFEVETDLLGQPVLEAEVSSDLPAGLIVARLCDVAPDGTSLRISYGMLDLAYRDGFARAEPVTPDTWYPIRLPLDILGHRVAPGHSLRLAISTSYWPMIWPAPEPFCLSLKTGAASLSLPVRPAAALDAALRPFAPPPDIAGAPVTKVIPQANTRRLEVDLATNEFVFLTEGDGGEFGGAELARIDEIGLDLGYHIRKEFRIREDDPLSASAQFRQRAMLRRGDWEVTVTCETRQLAGAAAFELGCKVSAFAGTEEVFAREWTETVPRQASALGRKG